MAVTIKLPTQLREAAGNQTEAQVDGATVGEALDSLYIQHGELRQRIADDGGGLRRFVNVYLGGEDIRFLEGLDTPVSDGDELTILPAVAGLGGARRREVVGRRSGRARAPATSDAANASMLSVTDRS